MYAFFTTQNLHSKLTKISRNLSLDDLKKYCLDPNNGGNILFLGESIESLIKSVFDNKFYQVKQSSPCHTSLTFLFTGQGSQVKGMFTPWMQYEVFKKSLSMLFDNQSDMKHLIEKSNSDEIHLTQYTQPALYAFEWAISQIWSDLGINAHQCIGHSVGEYSAFAYAQSFSALDGYKLISYRAHEMSLIKQQGGMLAIKMDEITSVDLLKIIRD